MKSVKTSFLLLFIALCLLPVCIVLAQEGTGKHSVCPVCGMHIQELSQKRMLIEYDDNMTVGTCNIRCTAIEFAAHRERTLKNLQVSDYLTKRLIDARRAHWVIGGNRTDMTTKRAKCAFEKREDAENYVTEFGGNIAGFDEALRAAFEDMYADLKAIHGHGVRKHEQFDDIDKFPECSYCGMKRNHYAYSRTLIEYIQGTASGMCSIHCAAIDLGFNAHKITSYALVADYNTKKLIDAQKAVWVIGGEKPGVMTIRAKWAFEKKEDASEFIRRTGGKLSTFDEIMQATFEDMYEILR